jgi:hypothetical protein
VKRAVAIATGIVLLGALTIRWGGILDLDPAHGVAFARASAPRQVAASGGQTRAQSGHAPSGPGLEGRPEVPPPPFTDGIYPCTACHAELPVNKTRRELADMHADIVLRHDEEHRWCLDCHDASNRDVLHLASGEPVPFEESYRLCGQCHGEKLRDWRAGVHGRRTGDWNGHKKYLLCAHCHNPHQPRFAKLQPKPAPLRPVGSRQQAAGSRQ